LFQRKSFGLGDKEVGKDEASNAGRTPDKEHLNSQVRSLDAIGAKRGWVNEVGGRVANAKVPQPVAGDSEGHALSTNAEGEEFSGKHPDHWTPRSGEEGDIDASKGDQHSLG